MVAAFQSLSQRIALALEHEERRCGYLSVQAKLMIDCIEDVNSMAEGPFHWLKLLNRIIRFITKRLFLQARKCRPIG